MSIRDEIQTRVAEGRLFHLMPAIPGDPVVRTMFISKEINGLLKGPWESETLEKRFGRLRADLESFITGQQIALCLRPFEANVAYMGRLDPTTAGIWDIRSRDPKPGLRVFGGFSDADPDTFVSLTWSPRKELRDRYSREWSYEIERCKAEWRKLFHPYEPKKGEGIHDFVTTNVFSI